MTFDPNAAFDDLAVGETRDTSFTYTLTDSEGGTDTATVTVTVTGVNDAPIVVGGSEIADASGNDGETITAIDVTTAFSDPDTTDTLTYTATGLPAGPDPERHHGSDQWYHRPLGLPGRSPVGWCLHGRGDRR